VALSIYTLIVLLLFIQYLIALYYIILMSYKSQYLILIIF